MATVDQRSTDPLGGPNAQDKQENWIESDREQEATEKRVGVTQARFLECYSANAANTKSSDPKEGILLVPGADATDVLTLRLRYFGWLVINKVDAADRPAAIKLLTEEVEHHENDVHKQPNSQIPPPLIDEVVGFVNGRGSLKQMYFKYNKATKIWDEHKTPDFDTPMDEEADPSTDPSGDEELHFEDRPKFVEGICNETNATELMKNVLNKPEDSETAQNFSVAVNARVSVEAIGEDFDPEAYLLKMGLIRLAVMVCAGNGRLALAMKKAGLSEAGGKKLTVLEAQMREHRLGFRKEIGSKGYPTEWTDIFDKVVVEQVSRQRGKTTPLYTNKDVAAAVGDDYTGKAPISYYCTLKAFEEVKEAEEAQNAKRANVPEESPGSGTPTPASNTSKVGAVAAKVSYMNEVREVGAVKIANWKKYAKAQETGSACTPTYEVLIRMNENTRNGTPVIPWWHIVKEDLLDFDVAAYGVGNICDRPGEKSELTTLNIEKFNIEGIAIAPRANLNKNMPDMLVFGHCGDKAKAQLYTRSTLSDKFDEKPVVRKLLKIMADNGIPRPDMPPNASLRTLKIWKSSTNTTSKQQANPVDSTERPNGRHDDNGKESGGSDPESDTNDGDGFYVPAKPQGGKNSGAEQGSKQREQNVSMDVIEGLKAQMKSMQDMLTKLTAQIGSA